MEDIEKEANVMQDKLFDGELVTRGILTMLVATIKPQTGNWRHYSNNNNVNCLVHMIKQTKFLGKLNLSETRSSLVIQILEAYIERG